MLSRRRVKGFTLVELMIVVVVLGVLASVAVQSYRRFILQSKTSEASINLKQIVNGEIIYYSETHMDKNEKLLPRQFLSLKATPDEDPCPQGVSRYKASTSIWKTNGWDSIQFAIHNSHYYQYKVESSGIKTNATFTASARGNIDCDSTFSTFRVMANIGPSGDPVILGMVISNELE
ncbi:MAG: prepilin-type N-terminal cleavage/methylation domain-containing protein [Deltaproteobacteria bacterium]|nr:MAG: prepilin-type N-terminal cleavage/methylation domain-containing protein [Deltaproteobacteria bacterium]